MPKLAAFADIKQTRVEYPVPGGYTRAITSFFPRPDNSSVDMPMAFLADGSPGRILRTHYHHTDQFQVIILGDDALNRSAHSEHRTVTLCIAE